MQSLIQSIKHAAALACLLSTGLVFPPDLLPTSAAETSPAHSAPPYAGPLHLTGATAIESWQHPCAAALPCPNFELMPAVAMRPQIAARSHGRLDGQPVGGSHG